MKLLKFPYAGDPILNRIESLKKHIWEDESGEYIDEILLLAEEFCRSFPVGQFAELDHLEEKIAEARFWLNEFMSDPLDPDLKNEEKKNDENS